MNEELMVVKEDVQTIDEGDKDWIEHSVSGEDVRSLSETVLETDEVNKLQSRWNSIQAEFVDRPRTSVEHADALVTEALDEIESLLSKKRAALAEGWVEHEDASTEDLRIALHGYRSFFNRLLAL